MDYRVIGHETLELDFGNQKVLGSRRFLRQNPKLSADDPTLKVRLRSF